MGALVGAGLIDPATIVARVEALETDAAHVAAARARAVAFLPRA